MAVWPTVASATVLEMDLIATTTLGAPAAAITISGISNEYCVFELVGWWLLGTNDNVGIRFNNDSGANYEYEQGNASNATVSSQRVTASASILLLASLDTSTVGAFTATFSKPAVSMRAGFIGWWSFIQSAVLVLQFTGGSWINTTDLITRVDMFTNTTLATGSVITLGGARAA